MVSVNEPPFSPSSSPSMLRTRTISQNFKASNRITSLPLLILKRSPRAMVLRIDLGGPNNPHVRQRLLRYS